MRGLLAKGIARGRPGFWSVGYRVVDPPRLSALMRRLVGAVLPLLAVALVLSCASAFATGPCDALTTDLSGTTATGGTVATDAVACIMGSISPGAILAAVVAAFIPLIIGIWGLRGAVALVARVVKSMFSVLRART